MTTIPFYHLNDPGSRAGTNRPFYRYDGHIELSGFKEYNAMPRGGGGGGDHEPMYTQQYLRPLLGPIFLYVFLEKDCNGRS